MQLVSGRPNQRGLMGLGDFTGPSTPTPAGMPEGSIDMGYQASNYNCPSGYSQQRVGISTVCVPKNSAPAAAAAAPIYQAPAPAPATAPITITVPTNVTTTISPQISPVMQQSSGSGSLSAGTTQAGNSPGSSGLTASDIQKMLDQQNAAMQAQFAAQQAAQLQAQQAAAQAAQAAAMTPIPQAAQEPITGPTMAVAPGVTAQIPTATTSSYSNTMILLTLAGVVAAYMALEDKGKHK